MGVPAEFFLEREMFQAEIAEQIKKHLSSITFFSENYLFYVEKYGIRTGPQMAMMKI